MNGLRPRFGEIERRGRMRTARPRRCLAAATATLAVSLPLLGGAGTGTVAASAAPACDTGNIVVHRADWQTIKLPSFPEDSASTWQTVTDPSDPSLIFVFTSEQIQRSTDGGCHWKKVLELTDAPQGNMPSRHEYDIRSLKVPPHQPGSKALVYAYATRFESGIQFFVSNDAGDTWDRRPGPEAVTGVSTTSPDSFVMAPSDPHRLYVPATQPLYRPPAFYYSDDGAKTWRSAGAERPSRPSFMNPDPLGETGDVPVADVRNIAVDPLDKDTIWVFHQDLLKRSTDKGETFTVLFDPPGQGSRRLYVSHPPGREAIVALLPPTNCRAGFQHEELLLSVDGGRSFLPIPTPPGSSCDIDLAFGSARLVWTSNMEHFGSAHRRPEHLTAFKLDMRSLGRDTWPWVQLPVVWETESTGPLYPQLTESAKPAVMDTYRYDTLPDTSQADADAHFIERYIGRI